MKISLDKIAKKNESLASIKKPWEKVVHLDKVSESEKSIKEGSKGGARRPRFEIPESNKKKLSDISQSLDFLIDIVKM